MDPTGKVFPVTLGQKKKKETECTQVMNMTTNPNKALPFLPYSGKWVYLQ